MNASFPSFHSSLALLQAVENAVKSLALSEGVPLFQLVRLYDSTDIDKAFADTLAARQQRLCFIIPERVSFESTIDGRTAHVKKHFTFGCLLCDTDRKTGQSAVFGSVNNPGTIALNDLLVEGLAGRGLDFRGVCLVPEDGTDLVVTKDGDSDSGRKGWIQYFRTVAGTRGFGIY
jgi:hypothetical protein